MTWKKKGMIDTMSSITRTQTNRFTFQTISKRNACLNVTSPYASPWARKLYPIESLFQRDISWKLPCCATSAVTYFSNFAGNNTNYSRPNSRSQWSRGLRRRSASGRLLRLWVRIPPGVRMSVVSVVCCYVEVSATSWSLVQRSSTDCGASLCVI